MTTVYIVTDKELGWDNICGVYTSEEEAKKAVEARGGDTSKYQDHTLEEEYYE